MTARIDPGRQVVEAGGETYGFRLDCRTEAAVVAVGGQEYRVRSLRWQEKVSLSRFVALGADVSKRELVRLCTDGEPDPAATDVLWELAWWLNEPAAVPFDSRALAAVTLQLCRDAHLRPADLDTRSASEIEGMWQALGGAAAAQAAPQRAAGGDEPMTRIVIVPDGGADGEVADSPSPGVPRHPLPALRGEGERVGAGNPTREAGVVRPSRTRSSVAPTPMAPDAPQPREDRQSCLSGSDEHVTDAGMARSSDTPGPRGTRGLHRESPAGHSEAASTTEPAGVVRPSRARSPEPGAAGDVAQTPNAPQPMDDRECRQSVSDEPATDVGMARSSDTPGPRGTRGLHRDDSPVGHSPAAAGVVRQSRARSPESGAVAEVAQTRVAEPMKDRPSSLSVSDDVHVTREPARTDDIVSEEHATDVAVARSPETNAPGPRGTRGLHLGNDSPAGQSEAPEPSGVVRPSRARSSELPGGSYSPTSATPADPFPRFRLVTNTTAPAPLTTRADRDALFDDLADRLAEAAADMGIEV